MMVSQGIHFRNLPQIGLLLIHSISHIDSFLNDW